ncbi:MAG: YbgC/FadM family acyl-CoA thioesterase [Porphyrobacter sp.]|nr:YbgC/FadM family acyl-CoA thioesterase [Porphyrobacter sp.]
MPTERCLPPPAGLLDGALHLYPLRVHYDDTDLSGIVYHANYLKWFERARSDMLRLVGIEQRGAVDAGEGAYAVAELSIRYRAPARLDDALTIATRIARFGAASVELIQRALRSGPAGAPDLLAEARVRVGFVAPDGRPRRQPAAWRLAIAALIATKDSE